VSPLNQRDAAAGAKAGGDAANNVMLRIASAAVLAPIAICFAYIGGWLFLALCAAAAARILWEWTQLVADHPDRRVLLPGFAALIVALFLTGFDEPAAAATTIVIGAALAAGTLMALPRRFPARNTVRWAVGGILYSGIAFLGPAVLRRDPTLGFTAVLFVALTVWATDICAYASGRAIGGPLLWPEISPHKTWAGAIGGVLGGVAAGTMVAYASGVGMLAAIGVIALLLSLLTQVGDLFESAVKRRFGAKDASYLIPGHGGLMDRLDGFLVAGFAGLLIGLIRAGIAAPAQGLLVW
jgi:phosphatidate cytidylyltransferase